MADTPEKEVLEVGVDLKSVLADMAKWQRMMMKHMDGVGKSVTKLNKLNTKSTKTAKKGNKEWEAGIEDLTKAYRKEGEEIQKLTDTMDILQKKADASNDDERKAIEDQIKSLKKLSKEKVDALKGRENKEGVAKTNQMFKEAGSEMKDALKDALHSVMSKDLKGIVEDSAKVLVKGLKLSAMSGLKLGGAGAAMKDRGKSRGGAVGAAMNVAGSGMKGMGAMMGGIKPLIESISKLGPILGLVGGAIMGIVKLFLDLDAKAKEFNKDILASASTAEILAQAGGDTDMAFSQMKDTLRGVRDAAYDLSNIEWGISPDQFKAVLNTLNQEGVSLNRIGQEAERAGKTVEDFTMELAHVGVAYSRAFGVPITEINQLQAEMMTEMGADLKGTRLAFQQMDKAATDSGISANKFFGMIRGVSQDLSLWGTRMEDAVKLLGRLGKVMNPRNAQKFMQAAVQGLKNMGRTERLRLTLLTGQGKMGALIDRDIKRKAEGLASTLNMTGDQLIEKMQKEGPAGLEDAINQLPKEMQGATREALIDMNLQQKRAAKGTFGMSGAARSMGPTGALQAMTDALKRFAPGAKNLSDAAGTIGGEMMADQLGVSEDQLDQMIKFETSLNMQRDVLKKQLESGDADQMAAARKQLKKAHIDAKTDEELKKKIDAAGYDEIMDTLDDDTKKTLEDSAKVEDLAKKQADLQVSLVDKVGMIVDFLMNQIYNILTDIWDLISTLFGGKKDHDLQKNVYQAHDPAMMKIFDETKGDINKFREQMIGKGGIGKTIADRLANFANAKTETEKISAGADLKQVTLAINNGMKQAGNGAATSTLKDAGVGDDKISKVLEMMDKGVDFSKAMVDAGVDNDKQALALQKSLWFLDPAFIATMGSLMGKQPTTTTTAAPTDQASSAAKSANTGQHGGGQAAMAAPTGGASTPASKDAAKAADDSLSMSKEQLATMQSVDQQMDKFKMDTSFLSGPYSKAVEGSVLKAVRTALFEYYLYKDLDKGQVSQSLQASGGNIGSFVQGYGTSAANGMSPQNYTNTMLESHAMGGTVTGVANGLASVTAAAGEGLASIGPGERIVPAGGGGGRGDTYQINVNGIGGADLAAYLKKKVVDGVYEYKRKERFST